MIKCRFFTRKKILFLFVVNIYVCLFSDNIEDIIPSLSIQDISNLNNSGFTVRNRVNYKEGLRLLPNIGNLKQEFNTELNNFNPELCVEMLYVINKIDSNINSSLLKLLNDFRAFSKLSGVTYYSSNRKKVMPLIEESFFVDNKKNKILDPVEFILPTYQEHILFQDDTTFNKNYYNIITRTNSNTFWVLMENIETLKIFGFFKVLESKSERINFVIQNTNDFVLIYALAEIKDEPKVKKLFNIPIDIPAAFKKRVQVIVDWYIKRIN